MSDDDDSAAVSELVENLVAWFRDRYDDPAEHLPWDGGYVWIVRQCDAREELETAFPEVPPLFISRAVEVIECDGWEWVRAADIESLSE